MIDDPLGKVNDVLAAKEAASSALGKVQRRIRELRLKTIIQSTAAGANVLPFGRRATDRQATASPQPGVFFADRDGRFIFTNIDYQRLTGTTLTASLGYGWTRLLPRGRRRETLRVWRNCLRKGQPFTMKAAMVRQDTGAVVEMMWRAMPMMTADGEVVGYTAVAAQADAHIEKLDARAAAKLATTAPLLSVALAAFFLWRW